LKKECDVNLKSLIGAGTVVVTAAFLSAAPAQAALISSDSQLEIAGGLVDLTTINIASGGNVTFLDNTVAVDSAFGDFASLADTIVTFTNPLTLTVGETIYVGDSGLSFTATSFNAFDNVGPEWGFEASGIITLDGFDATPGFFAFSTQRATGATFASFSTSTTVIPLPASVFMLMAALGGLGVVSRRRSATA
jgi:hypothetical protein